MTNKEPIVSVIIPTFRRKDELKRALDSCVKQMYNKIEIIVVNDDPSDDLESLKVSYPQIIWLHNKQNMGAPFSRNRGLAASKGEFINFLDDDDELFPEKIEKQVAEFQSSNNPRLGVVTCDVEYIGPGKKVITENRMRGDIYRAQLTKYCVYGIQSMLIKKVFAEQTGGFDIRLQSNQEYDLSIRLSRVCEFENLHEILVRTNESKDQISYNFKKKLSGTLRLYRKYFPEFYKAGPGIFFYNQIRFGYLITLYLISFAFGDVLYRKLSRF
jgi:glycosyltransferase involved in cell wall biosynthesis